MGSAFQGAGLQAWSLLPEHGVKLSAAPVLLVVIAVSTYIVFQLNNRRSRGPLPPGPWPWPIVGNLPQIGPIPHQGMRKLTQRYGSLFYLKLGTVKAVVTDDPIMVAEFLKKQDHVFASRPHNIASEHFTYGGQDIAFSPYNAHWRAMRRLCVFELLTPRRLDYFRHGRMEEVQCMVREVLASSMVQKPINLRDTFGSLSSNTLTRMVLGKRFFGAGESGPDDAAEHKALIYAAFALINAFNVADYLPFLRPFDVHGHEKAMRAIMARVDEIYDAIIYEHHHRMEHGSQSGSEHSSFMDQLLSLPGENGEEQLKHTTIKAILIDLVAAGTDTSSITSEWTMAELLQHPEVMKEVKDEIDRVVGRERLVDEGDLASLQHLKAAVKEVFRLHPVGAFLIPHVSLEDTHVAGYYIPKGTRALINTYALGRNGKVWESPDEFRPWRFLDECDIKYEGAAQHVGAGGVELNDANLLRIVPFGSGRRGCPGASLGSNVVLLGLATLIQAFDWSPSTLPLNLREAHGLMVLEQPLHALATPRLPPSLYP